MKKKTLCLKQVRQVSKTVAFQCPRWNCINFYWELTLSSLTAPATLKGEEVGVIAVAPQTEVGPSDGISLACVQYELGLCELHSARAQLIPLIIHIGHLHRQKWQDGWAKKTLLQLSMIFCMMIYFIVGVMMYYIKLCHNKYILIWIICIINANTTKLSYQFLDFMLVLVLQRFTSNPNMSQYRPESWVLWFLNLTWRK